MTNVTTPDFVEALRARDRERINHVAERMLDQRVSLRGEWFEVAKVLASNMEVTLAVKAARRGFEELGNSASARFRLADLLATVGRQSEALDLLAEVSIAIPNALELDQFVGTCAMEIGAIDLAREALERVVATWPGAGAAWLSLAALPPSDDELLLDRMVKAGALVRAARASDRAQWHYAKGTVLDRLGQTDDAFTEFSAGAAIVAKHRPYDQEADRANADRLIAEFDPETITRIADRETAAGARVIFVIGLPRSGTTLVEHIISGHSSVAGGDELPFGVLIANEAGGNSAAVLDAPAGKRTADRLADLYHHFGNERFGFERRFIDKSVDNSRTIGLLAAILPAAPIVWLRRDPLNCAWSCFRTYFSEGVEWSWSLSDIAAHFKAEDRLYAHWREALGDRMLTVAYEELVSDTEAEAGRLFKHVGLEWDAEAPAPHDVERAVTTASLMQVRRPIYRSSINAADPYRKYLQPFIDAYTPAASDHCAQSAMPTGATFSLNPALDEERLADAFKQNPRLEIIDFLAPGQAEALKDSLLGRQDWALILNTRDQVFDIPRSAFHQLTDEQRAALDRLTIEAARDGFHFRYEAIRVPDDIGEPAGNDLLTAFVRFMASEETARFFRKVTGIDDIAFADGKATAYSAGHFLTAHTDDVEGKQRRAAYVLSLSPFWRPEWGGLLMFHDAQDNIEEVFTPRMGALRLFEVPVRHSVSYVNPIAPEARLSVTGWLRAAEPARDQSSE